MQKTTITIYKQRTRSSYFYHNIQQIYQSIYNIHDYLAHKHNYDNYSTLTTTTTITPLHLPSSTSSTYICNNSNHTVYDMMEMELVSPK